VTAQTFFERLYLVPGLSPYEPRVKCPCAPTPPPFAKQLFLDFCEMFFPEWPLNIFFITIRQIIWPSPGTLVGSWVFFSLVGACCWRGGLCFGKGRDRGFLLYIFLFLRVLEWWVGVCLYTRVHKHRILGYLVTVSPSLGRTPGEPEESRLNKAQYTCRPYMCTKDFRLDICWAAGFDDLV